MFEIALNSRVIRALSVSQPDRQLTPRSRAHRRDRRRRLGRLRRRRTIPSSATNFSAPWRTAVRPAAAPAGCRSTRCCATTAGLSWPVVPMYAKSHSYGEYVFDHGWANALRAGRRRLLPEAAGRGAVQPGAGSAAAAPPRHAACPSRRMASALEQACRALTCPRCTSPSAPRTEWDGAGRCRLAAAHRHAVPLGECRLRRASTTSSARCPPASARCCGANGAMPMPRA